MKKSFPEKKTILRYGDKIQVWKHSTLGVMLAVWSTGSILYFQLHISEML